VTPDNPVPYFMFNLNEPGEEALTAFRKEQRRKNRLRIDTTDWSRVPRLVKREEGAVFVGWLVGFFVFVC